MKQKGRSTNENLPDQPEDWGRRDALSTIGKVAIGAGIAVAAGGGIGAYLLSQKKPQSSQSSKSVTIAWVQDVSPLNPTSSTGAYDTGAGSSIYQALYGAILLFDSDGSIKPAYVDTWSVSSDLSSLTLNLRHDLKFHNGDQVTANDLAFTFQQYSNSSYYGSSTWTSKFKSWNVVNDFQLDVQLTEYTESTLTQLGIYGWLLPQDYYTKVGASGFERAPVGAGPYKFVSTSSGALQLAAFDEYFLGTPPIENIIFQPVLDASSRAAAIQSGSAQLTLNLNPQDYNTIAGTPGLKGIKDPILQIVYFIINPYFQPFSSRNVRLALEYAIDKASLVTNVLAGQGTPVNMMDSQGYAAYDPSFAGIPYDVSKAQSLMSQAGYSESNTLSMNVMTTQGKFAGDYDIAQACIGMWRQAYFNPTLQVVTPAQFSQYRAAGQLGALALNNWAGNDGQPLNGTYYELSPSSIFSGYGGLSNKTDYTGLRSQLQNLTSAIMASTNATEQALLARQADEFAVLNAALVLPLYQAVENIALVSNLNLTKLFPDGIIQPYYLQWSS